MDFFAHSTARLDKQDWQLLHDHLKQVGRLARARGEVFGAGEMADVAGLLHDLGKYTERFQGRLEGDPARVDHATWGAQIARQRYGQVGTLLAYGIAGHHAGLANGVSGEQRTALTERLATGALEALPPLLPVWEREIELPSRVSLPMGFRPVPARGAFQLALLARMVFSCLVDADFVDTDNFYRQIEGRAPRPERQGPALAALRERLDAYLARFPREGGINPLRSEILRHVRGQASQAPGLFSLTVPTGGGKTLASLAFALDHAIVHGLRRVIYVIPFTSIVE